MAQCGIKKYDLLPGRVGLIDVDAARSALSIHNSVTDHIKKRLDKAVELNKKSKRR